MNPKLHIIAGPNGAGKTTFAGRFLPTWTNYREFVNADEIARRLSPENPEAAAFQAGRQMLERIRALSEQRVDFAIETTLSGKSYLPWLRQLKANGYEIHLYFVWLPDVQMSLNRVADRVRKGGHNIPEEVIRRRYAAGIKNLFQYYRPIATSWTLFDNSKPLLYTIASETDGALITFDAKMLAEFMKISEIPVGDKLSDSHNAPIWVKAAIAMRSAMTEVIAEHCKTGHPLIVWRDGKVYRQPPEEAKREMEQALKNDPWAAEIEALRRQSSR